MSNLNKLLLAGQFPPGNNSLNHFEKLFAQKVGDSGVITTTTGNPVSIVTSGAQNAISTLLSFSPKQSGSGDPSPINIRPIVPWTEANLTGAGKNLFDYTAVSNGYIENSNGAFIANANYKCSDYIEVVPNTQYREVGQKGNNWGAWYDSEKHFISGIYSFSASNERVLTAPNNARYMRVTVYNSGVGYDYTQTLICVSSLDNTFEPYITPTTTTINLGGTYYGFSVDVERGVLRATHIKQTIDGDRVGSAARDNNMWRLFFQNSLPDSEKALSNYPPLICNRYLGVQSYSVANRTNNSVAMGDASMNNILVRDDTWENVTGIKTDLTNAPMVICYPVLTPLEIPLTPQTVALLAGNNTLWTDGDEISITYKAKRA